jgi:hypothetical protein
LHGSQVIALTIRLRKERELDGGIEVYWDYISIRSFCVGANAIYTVSIDPAGKKRWNCTSYSTCKAKVDQDEMATLVHHGVAGTKVAVAKPSRMKPIECLLDVISSRL